MFYWILLTLWVVVGFIFTYLEFHMKLEKGKDLYVMMILLILWPITLPLSVWSNKCKKRRIKK